MSNTRVKMTVEFDINEDVLKEHGLSADDILKNVIMREDDVVDGFQIGPVIDGIDSANDFFLTNGSITEREILSDEPVKEEVDGLFIGYVDGNERDPLIAFIEREVPFRMRELNDIKITLEEANYLINEVKENTDILFDYDGFDAFLLEKHREFNGLDKDKIAALQGHVHNLRKELDGAAVYDSEIEPELEKILSIHELELEAAKIGVDIDLSPDKIIDLEHLNCFWYGGHIGSIVYKGYTISVEVHGDVNVSVLSDDCSDVLFSYKNKNNSGVQSHDEIFECVDNDLELETLDNEGRLAWENNNWVEFFVFDKDGNNVPVPMVETVLDDNVLEAFEDVSFYKDLIDEIIQKTSEKEQIANCEERLFVFDDEIMINDDRQSINAYLWAVDSLVDRLPSSEHMENINFYVIYNVKTNEVRLVSTYDTPVEDGELNKMCEISLSKEEKTALVSGLEDYCKKQYSQSCLEFVNDIRNSEKLVSIEHSGRLSLTQQINSAENFKVVEDSNLGDSRNDIER